MLFGAMFSTYVLLRVGGVESGPARWMTGEEAGLSWKIGAFNTLVLIISSVTMVMAWYWLKKGNLARGKMFLLVTVGLAIVFLVVKLTMEYLPKWEHGIRPATNTYYALYFTMTGLHALHIIAGVVVMLYFLGPGAALWHKDPEYYTNRIECTGLYWHFVDLVWIFLFPVLYLL
ncbi:MAG: cytochrome c oxidase subunit 3 [Planctomycetes bacterium]|nr:cytochrome c oxidase subunit 3 [Planctomycetota bacterium]